MKDIPDVIAMAPLVLECPKAGCDLGDSGAKYKTPELEEENAMRMLDHHVQQNHVQGQTIAAAPATSKNMRERQRKPSADVEMPPVYLTIPGATLDELLVVRDILVTGTAAVPKVEKVNAVKEILKMLMIEDSLVCCQAKMIDVTGLLDKYVQVKEEIVDGNCADVVFCKSVNDMAIKMDEVDEDCE